MNGVDYLNFDDIQKVALIEMKSRVSLDDRVDIEALIDAIAIAITKAIEKYDKQKNH